VPGGLDSRLTSEAEDNLLVLGEPDSPPPLGVVDSLPVFGELNKIQVVARMAMDMVVDIEPQCSPFNRTNKGNASVVAVYAARIVYVDKMFNILVRRCCMT
jgi:hypothetical protein